MLDPNDPPEVQIAKQQKIINALIRRSNRQRDLGPSAFRAFQSALELQETVAAQTRDLQRAATELESARYERERTRRILAEALSSMDGGFALFSDGNLELCNDLFRTLLPDIQDAVRPGLPLGQFLTLASSSKHLVSSEQPLSRLDQTSDKAGVSSAVIELREDRWFQIGAQNSADDNLILLMTEITSLVRRNRDEKEILIDRQADYLQAVFQSMNPGICTFSESGEVMMHNGRFPEILGVSRELVDPGTQLTDILQFVMAHRLEGASKGMTTERWRRELQLEGWLQRRLQDKDGKVLDIQASCLPDGGFVVELMDVTLSARNTQVLEERVMERTAELTQANAKLVREYDEKARVEEELRLAKERAEAAVSSKTRFLAAASHDLLQPINAAKLLISTLSETTRETETAAMVERLESAFGSAEQLLHSLLDISRLESPDPDAVTPSDVCLGPILQGIHTDQTPFADQRRVRLDVVPSSAFVHSDPVYLLRSIQNLVVNALQYTDPGGRVLFGCRRRQGKVVVEVWDNGVGIPRKDQVRIFEEFARAENATVGSGMGLGLSVVDRACRLLGHGLNVRSKPNVGSVFSIEMDEVAPRLSRPEARTPIAASQDQRLAHIVLVLENDGLVLDGMTRWLEQWGASVLPASLTSEALHYVEDMGMPPDIILADYQLHGDETGIDAIAQMRDMTGTQVPAILITANQTKRVRQEAEANDISVMHKPAKLGRLRAMIDGKVRSHNALETGVGLSVTSDMQTKVAGD
ncbi:MAG: PAS-domain containing protein [Pseudomonadota bacterium]